VALGWQAVVRILKTDGFGGRLSLFPPFTPHGPRKPDSIPLDQPPGQASLGFTEC
jgi:hypothetical protein